EVLFVADVRIELVAEARLASPGEKARPRRAAIRCRDVAIGTAHPACRQRVNVWRRDAPTAMNSNVAVAKVVRDNDQYVGFAGPLGGMKSCQRGEHRAGDDRQFWTPGFERGCNYLHCHSPITAKALQGRLCRQAISFAGYEQPDISILTLHQ